MTIQSSKAIRFEPASCFRGIQPYTPEARAPWIDLNLDANEAPFVLPELFGQIESMSPEELSKYPSTSGLSQALANKFGLHSSRVVVTGGGDDAIDCVCRVALSPGRRLITHTPTFEMITRSARLAGGNIEAVAWSRGEFPIQDFLDRMTPDTGLVAIVSPNNPTGLAVSGEVIRRVAAAAEHVGALVLVDLAYVEFADNDPMSELLSLGNVVVIRTFSKAFGLAGLRVGYAVASESVALLLRTAGGPYPVSSPSLRIAECVLSDSSMQEQIQDVVSRVREQRGALSKQLEVLDCKVSDSQANFVLVRSPRAHFLWSSLRSLGIAVRRYEGRADLDDAVRITLPGDDLGYARLSAAITAILSPEAILFDLDGVLADVGNSYREAIKRTANEYKVEVSSDDIQRVKEAGNANNDWIVTQRLLAEHNVVEPIERIRECFQDHYLGTHGRVGLRESERLIPEIALLRSFSGRFKMAIVTGRPRVETDWFLDRYGIRELFDVCVCMEDAPAKPSSAPIKLAIEQLGVSAAWMVGDTPDDVVAARGAGVLPIGIIAPGWGESRQSLLNSGAAHVTKSVCEISELLP